MRIFEFAEKNGLSIEKAILVIQSAYQGLKIADAFQELPPGFEENPALLSFQINEALPSQGRGFNWSVGNFKAIGNTQSLRLKPITLVFGPNSAGKSSLLHSLLFFDHFYHTRELDFSFPRLTGDAVDLGGFRNVTFGKNIEESPIQFGFETDLRHSAHGRHPRLPGVEVIKMEVTFKMPTPLDNLVDSLVEDKAPVGSGVIKPRPIRLVVDINGEPFWVITRQADGGYRTSSINVAHLVFQTLVRSLEEALAWKPVESEKSSLATQNFLEHCFLEEGISWIDAMPFTGSVRRFNSLGIRAKDFMLKMEASQTPSPIDFVEHHETVGRKLDDFANLLFSRIDNNLHDRFSNYVYLGPIRNIPDRYFAFSNRKESNWLASGGEAWDILKRSPDAIAVVNKWLGDERFLKTPYHIKKRLYLTPGSIREEIEKSFHDVNNNLATELGEDTDHLLDNIEGSRAVDAEIYTDNLLHDIVSNAPHPRFEDLQLYDIKKKVAVGHRDVGVGISQLLPVLVYAMAYRKKTIAIEQPEIHIHPALQAELGDVFIRSALGESANNFLIETHSEHLILRLLRRIRECSENNLDYPSDLPKIRPEDVAVLYVEPGPEGATIRELGITSDGDFADNWPNGFFTERFKEYP